MHLMVHEIDSLDFRHNSNSNIMSHCIGCSSCIIQSFSSNSSGGTNNKHQLNDTSGIMCDVCKKEDRNKKWWQANVKPEHGTASNHTTYANLAKLPDGTWIVAKLRAHKQQVRSRVKQIKQLEATISMLKSESNEVKTKIPPEIDGKPGAIQWILGMILNKVEDEKNGSSNEKKRKKEVIDQIVMSLLNDALKDEEKDSPYNMDEAQFSPKVFQVVMKIWLWSPAAYKDLHKSGWIISLLSQQRLWDLCCDTMVDEGECISLYMPLGLPWTAWLQDWFSMAFSNAMKWNW